jgi:hypothetical protein
MSETHAQGSKASHAIEPALTSNPSQVQMETQLESEALRQPLLQLALHGVVCESEGLLVDDEVAAGEVCLGPGDSGGDGGSVGFEDDAEGGVALVLVKVGLKVRDGKMESVIQTERRARWSAVQCSVRG